MRPDHDRDPASVLDILTAARAIQRYVTNIDRTAFDTDEMRQDAIIRRIEIIGEAVRRVSPEFRTQHPQIPWQQMAGMRSKLIHDYDAVNLNDVWQVAHTDIPALINLLTPLVPPDEPDVIQPGKT
ncbi:MAG: HepT-like ribonuclease domain-containing protein [Aggregatilineales bacterium]